MPSNSPSTAPTTILGTAAVRWACFAVASASLPAHSAGVSFKELKAAQITAAVSGRYITDDRHWGHHYLADGRVMFQESGRDRLGSWSVQHDQLCLIKPQVSKTEPVCYTVQRQADQLQYLDDMKRVVYQGFVYAWCQSQGQTK
jgi:hypothetical protein